MDRKTTLNRLFVYNSIASLIVGASGALLDQVPYFAFTTVLGIIGLVLIYKVFARLSGGENNS